jgi:hypothetical protein
MSLAGWDIPEDLTSSTVNVDSGMSFLPAEKRRVFLAFRPIFVGPNAQLRMTKRFGKWYNSTKGLTGLLLKDYGFDKVVNKDKSKIKISLITNWNVIIRFRKRITKRKSSLSPHLKPKWSLSK